MSFFIGDNFMPWIDVSINCFSYWSKFKFSASLFISNIELLFIHSCPQKPASSKNLISSSLFMSFFNFLTFFLNSHCVSSHSVQSDLWASIIVWSCSSESLIFFQVASLYCSLIDFLNSCKCSSLSFSLMFFYYIIHLRAVWTSLSFCYFKFVRFSVKIIIWFCIFY